MTPPSFLEHLRRREAPFFFFVPNHSTAQRFRALYPEAARSIEDEARAICNGELKLWSSVTAKMGTDVAWNRDPLTHADWPVAFQDRIAFRNADDIGDVRTTWELNRQQWLVTVAQAWFLSETPRYGQELTRLLQSWGRNNPIDVGVNWISSMEAALRIHSWLWIAFYSCGQAGATAALSSFLLKGIVQHARHVEGNLSRHSSANNHLLIESGTLAMVGILLPELRDSNRWLRKGLDLLKRELPRQVRRDGFSAEQSVHYHCFVLEMLMQLVILGKKNEIALPEEISETCSRMTGFLSSLACPFGAIPNLGDSDDGRLQRLNPLGGEYANEILAAAAVAFENSAYRVGPDPLPEGAFWLVGDVGHEFFGKLGMRAEWGNLDAFRESGTAVLRAHSPKGRGQLAFDAGPHGDGRLCAHAHADALSVTLAVDGQEVLIDPGSYAYNIQAQMRDYLRSTEAHNTVTVDGASQAEPAGPFLWQRHVDAQLMECGKTEGLAFSCGRHSAYSPVTHWRFTTASDLGLFAVVDMLEGSRGEFAIAQTLHFAEEVTVIPREEKYRLSVDGRTLGDLAVGPKGVVREGVTTRPVSRRFLELHDAPALSIRASGSGTAAMILSLTTADAALEVADWGPTHVHLRGPEGDVFAGCLSGTSDYVTFRGHFVYLETDPSGKPQKGIAYRCEEVSICGQDIALDGAMGECRMLTW